MVWLRSRTTPAGGDLDVGVEVDDHDLVPGEVPGGMGSGVRRRSTNSADTVLTRPRARD
jgi:hypothetical protein